MTLKKIIAFLEKEIKKEMKSPRELNGYYSQ